MIDQQTPAIFIAMIDHQMPAMIITMIDHQSPAMIVFDRRVRHAASVTGTRLPRSKTRHVRCHDERKAGRRAAAGGADRGWV
jgi:hypothetical protein